MSQSKYEMQKRQPMEVLYLYMNQSEGLRLPKKGAGINLFYNNTAMDWTRRHFYF